MKSMAFLTLVYLSIILLVRIFDDKRDSYLQVSFGWWGVLSVIILFGENG